MVKFKIMSSMKRKVGQTSCSVKNVICLSFRNLLCAKNLKLSLKVENKLSKWPLCPKGLVNKIAWLLFFTRGCWSRSSKLLLSWTVDKISTLEARVRLTPWSWSMTSSQRVVGPQKYPSWTHQNVNGHYLNHKLQWLFFLQDAKGLLIHS